MKINESLIENFSHKVPTKHVINRLPELHMHQLF